MTNLIMHGLGVCSSQTKSVQVTDETTIAPDKVLIVYLSRTNNTKAVSEIIHRSAGGILAPLELLTPYPKNYQATVQQVVNENETGFMPPLKTKIANIQNYNVAENRLPFKGYYGPSPLSKSGQG